jgi:hypothetical protein
MTVCDAPNLLKDLIAAFPMGGPAGFNEPNLVGPQTFNPINNPPQVGGRVRGANQYVIASQYRHIISTGTGGPLLFGDIDLTMIFWYKPSVTGADMCQVSRWDDDGSNDRSWAFYQLNAGTLQQFQISGDGAGTAQVSAATFGVLTVDRWHWINGMYDAVNNVLSVGVNMIYDSVGATPGPRSASVANTYIGRKDNNPFPDWLSGIFCEFYAWERLLQPYERAYLFNGGLGRTFPFTDGAGHVFELGRHGRSRRLFSRLPGQMGPGLTGR